MTTLTQTISIFTWSLLVNTVPVAGTVMHLFVVVIVMVGNPFSGCGGLDCKSKIGPSIYSFREKKLNKIKTVQ